MEFLLSCSNRHLTRSLRSNYHIYARPCIILYIAHVCKIGISKFIKAVGSHLSKKHILWSTMSLRPFANDSEFATFKFVTS